MLGTDLVPPRHLGNNCSRVIGFRDDPALLFFTPSTPAANAGPDFNAATRPRSVKYIVDHICEPISPYRSTSADFSMPPQGAVKRPLTVNRRGEKGNPDWLPYEELPDLRGVPDLLLPKTVRA
jgi:hypothetical protein